MDTRLIAILVTTAVIHTVVGLGFLLGKNRATASQRTLIAELQEKWTEEDKTRKEAQDEELRSNYGANKLDRFAFDPRLDIRMTLLKLCQNALPSHFKIEVTVERFTEFRIFVLVTDMPAPTELAESLQEILTRVDPRWIYEIIITDSDRTAFKIIDQSQLVRVPDWKTATIPDIKSYCALD